MKPPLVGQYVLAYRIWDGSESWPSGWTALGVFDSNPTIFGNQPIYCTGACDDCRYFAQEKGVPLIVMPFAKHPYTCGICDWGRSPENFSMVDYKTHMKDEHCWCNRDEETGLRLDVVCPAHDGHN